MTTDDMDRGYLERDEYDGTKVIIFKTRVMNTKGELAVEFVTRWGMVAAVEDGEDSVGRQKVRLQTPTELVDRAISTAGLLVDRMDEMGWFLELPDPKVKEVNYELLCHNG